MAETAQQPRGAHPGRWMASGPLRVQIPSGPPRDMLVCVTGSYEPRFAGNLTFGDVQVSDDFKMIRIGRQGPVPAYAEILAGLPGDAREHVEAMRDVIHDDRVPSEPGPWLPYAIMKLYPRDWGEAASVTDERAAGQAPEAAADAGLPEGPLDVWLMPVVDFTLSYLVVPRV